MICFDIETGPLPWGLLQPLVPKFDEQAAVPDPGEFDLSKVAIGNLKDPAKLAAKLADARAAHDLLAETIPARRAEAYNNHVAKFKEKAALSACTGCVKAIGLQEEDTVPAIWCDFPEHELIGMFWKLCASDARESYVGHNIHGFDLPFLWRRSCILGVHVPDRIRIGRYWSSQFIDTMELWGCGQREYISLDAIDRALGNAGKPDDCTGADFARLFDMGGEEREKALAYLRNDLEMTRRVAEALRVL